MGIEDVNTDTKHECKCSSKAHEGNRKYWARKPCTGYKPAPKGADGYTAKSLGARGKAIKIQVWKELQEEAAERHSRAVEVLIKRKSRGTQDWHTEQLELAIKQAEVERRAAEAVLAGPAEARHAGVWWMRPRHAS